MASWALRTADQGGNLSIIQDIQTRSFILLHSAIQCHLPVLAVAAATNTSIDNIGTLEFHFGMLSSLVPSSTIPQGKSLVDRTAEP